VRGEGVSTTVTVRSLLAGWMAVYASCAVAVWYCRWECKGELKMSLLVYVALPLSDRNAKTERTVTAIHPGAWWRQQQKHVIGGGAAPRQATGWMQCM
jgi:hypothetical protein